MIPPNDWFPLAKGGSVAEGMDSMDLRSVQKTASRRSLGRGQVLFQMKNSE